MRLKIISNKIKCKKCGDVIESVYGNNFKYCKCKAVAIDGAHDMLRRIGNKEDYIELSEYYEIKPEEKDGSK